MSIEPNFQPYVFPWLASQAVDEDKPLVKLGKICDWSSATDQESKIERRRLRMEALDEEMSQPEEDTFSTVDRVKAKASKPAKKAGYKKESVEDLKRGGLKKRTFPERSQKPREPSIVVDPNWSLLEEIDLSRLMKLTATASAPLDLSVNGSCNYYNRAVDKIVTRLFENLVPTTRALVSSTANTDPIIKTLSDSVTEPTLYATDDVLTTLMCVTRSVYGWDIVVTKDGDKIFLDKRKGGPLEHLSVNENAPEPPSDEGLNSPASLALEATLVNQSFKDQAESISVADAAPFADDATLYRYRQYTLEDSINVVVRTQVDAAVEHSNGTTSTIPFTATSLPLKNTLLVNIHAVNEYDSKAVSGSSDYRQKLDAQRGAVFTTEIKFNGNKLAKWTLQSILSGADQMKIGFVSRASPKDKTRHHILGASTHKPADLASQMNLKMESAWGVVKAYAQMFTKVENGRYIMIRDANKPVLRVYAIHQANV